MPLLVHAVPRPLAVHGEPVQLARKAHREIRDIDHLLHLAAPFGQDFSHLDRDQRPQVVLGGAQFVGDLAHDLAAVRGRRHAPVEERFAGPRRHAFVIRHSGQLDFGQRFAGAGVQGLQVTAGRIGDPIAMAGAGVDWLDVQFFEDFGDLSPRGEHAHILAPRRDRMATLTPANPAATRHTAGTQRDCAAPGNVFPATANPRNGGVRSTATLTPMPRFAGSEVRRRYEIYVSASAQSGEVYLSDNASGECERSGNQS